MHKSVVLTGSYIYRVVRPLFYLSRFFSSGLLQCFHAGPTLDPFFDIIILSPSIKANCLCYL